MFLEVLVKGLAFFFEYADALRIAIYFAFPALTVPTSISFVGGQEPVYKLKDANEGGVIGHSNDGLEFSVSSNQAENPNNHGYQVPEGDYAGSAYMSV